jgi:hypothetical protein
MPPSALASSSSLLLLGIDPLRDPLGFLWLEEASTSAACTGGGVLKGVLAKGVLAKGVLEKGVLTKGVLSTDLTSVHETAIAWEEKEGRRRRKGEVARWFSGHEWYNNTIL